MEDAIGQRARQANFKLAEVEKENHILKRAVAIQNNKLKDALGKAAQS